MGHGARCVPAVLGMGLAEEERVPAWPFPTRWGIPAVSGGGRAAFLLHLGWLSAQVLIRGCHGAEGIWTHPGASCLAQQGAWEEGSCPSVVPTPAPACPRPGRHHRVQRDKWRTSPAFRGYHLHAQCCRYPCTMPMLCLEPFLGKPQPLPVLWPGLHRDFSAPVRESRDKEKPRHSLAGLKGNVGQNSSPGARVRFSPKPHQHTQLHGSAPSLASPSADHPAQHHLLPQAPTSHQYLCPADPGASTPLCCSPSSALQRQHAGTDR